ncbi:MAG: 30S ribosomal protein S1 [Betaproteobacteria bacterium TMED82]|nr:MAG: 30S ribosomal protein S1 [Betaproteobacteria bacterium TMED82]|tara:strand:- start:73534 stop:75279 length:1746 start_codon:yes stop_codon:yes gene_type:complete
MNLQSTEANTKTSNNPDSFASLFAESIAKKEMRAGEVISAEVIRIDQNHVVVNAGLKSESFIPLEEFFNDQKELDVKEGDFVSVAIESLEDGRGETKLSRDRAKRLAAWISLEKALDAGELITGTVTGRVKGGLTVMTNGIRAFLPGSLVDVRPVKDTSHIEGKTLDFKVIKLDRRRNNVVVSRRAIVESTMGEERGKLVDSLQEGASVKGLVKNITDYGAFIDLGGIDGLLHITDMAWKRVRHPSEILSIGQEITAKVLKFDQEKNRVSLGVKQLGDDPWEGVTRRYPPETRVFGKVTNITDYGAFVEIEPGIEGLVHVSEMDWTNKNVNPAKIVQSGDELEVMVLEIDGERRRISLGVKQCKANPWKDFEDSVNKGDKVKGLIKSITDFGVFIGLPGNIDGLVHLSDLSWSEPGEEEVKKYKKGEELEAVVMSVDVERERISLSVKQLNPVEDKIKAEKIEKGRMVKGVITKIEAKIATITLDSGLECLLRASDVSRERVEDMSAVLNIGDTVEAIVVNVNKKSGEVGLSIKAKEMADAAKVMEKMATDSSNQSGTTNLGALLKAKLDEPEEKSSGTEN